MPTLPQPTAYSLLLLAAILVSGVVLWRLRRREALAGAARRATLCSMIPEENEAVREAKRRRRVREALREPVQEEAMLSKWEDRILMRRQSFWIWMGLIPGLLAVPVWWDIFPDLLFPGPMFGISPVGPPRVIPWDNAFILSNLAFVLWLAYCSIRLVQTRRERSVLGDIWRSIALFLLFTMVNGAIFIGLFFASCVVYVKITAP